MPSRNVLAASIVVFVAGCSPPSATAPSSDPVPPADQGTIPAENNDPSGTVVLGTRRVRGLQLTLEAAKRKWRLGEHIVVHYVAKNVGDTRTSVSFGGDYRGSPRASRIKVTATDASGASLVDPHPNPMNFGGLGGEHELEPGEEFAFTVSLGRYRRFETAGSHHIAVAHDLGWTPEDEPVSDEDERWVEGELEIVVPSIEEAKTVLAEMQALPSDANKTVGERARPFADFTALSYPVYLPLLASAIETEPRAMTGVASIATVDATAVLLGLAKHTDPKISAPALDAVQIRLPTTGPTRGLNQAELDAWVARTWDAEVLGAPVRGLAESLLSAQDQEDVMVGARLLGAVAELEDADRVIRGLDRSLEATRLDPIPYPEPRTAVFELLATAEILLAAGMSAKSAPSTAGEIALYVLEHGSKRPRPAGYESLAAGWLEHDIPEIGVLVLRRTTAPLKPAVVANLPGLLSQPHVGLANAACSALGQAGSNAAVHEPVRAAMKTATDSWLVGCLHATAVSVGISRDAIAKTWVARLDEEDMTLPMLEQLLFVFDSSGHGSSGVPDAAEGARLKRVWTAWLREHGAVVRAGKRFALGDPALTTELFPAGFSLSDRAGQRWPEP